MIFVKPTPSRRTTHTDVIVVKDEISFEEFQKITSDYEARIKYHRSKKIHIINISLTFYNTIEGKAFLNT
ncbi:hypothetical protein [Vallitalea okinawensis]|uniref:hypothetical protein n=1 Tax=Vallitalea okinawensis TaxID=2078660 RepID=UPI000CFBFE07|nr:hypothetical protein [Vallitalea okinawensis]